MADRILIAVDPAELTALRDELAALRRAIEAVQMTPAPDWMPIQDYARRVGRSTKTVRTWIRGGSLETRRDGSVIMVRVK